MAKRFVYSVDGEIFQGQEAWGQAWKDAVKVAKAQHCPIFRSVERGERIDHEFYAKGGVFLSLRFYAPEKLYLF